nr:sulfotransferase [uncultured Desulfobacter sp.]
MVKKPIFMIGMPRSGTTIISEAISLHPDLGWFSNYLGRYPNLPEVALLDRVTNHPFIGWRLRGKKNQSKGITSYLRRFFPHTDEAFSIWEKNCGKKFLWDYLIDQKASKKESVKAKDYISRILRYQNKQRFFTKLTGPPRITYLKSIFPDAIFVHVIRDPRAVVSSLKNVAFWKGGKGLIEPWWKNGLTKKDIDEWKNYGKTPAALSAVQWKRVIELTWEEKTALNPKQFIEIRYEDFVINPHGSVQNLFNKMKLTDSILAHQYLSSLGKARNMNYKFQKNLTDNEIQIIEKITKKTASKAGYIFKD